ncbi:hypothetical protein HHL28_17115 [Aerophototrophica crusticola]|uniref:Uncharacterized protein n=1 Tax=Aerophototrophica crusticola TaxID=1709002 RepID=A0A858RAX2_9PROT|nr:hypothetical protein HHL28_17115 [Rhodospirillaceae bacterium B3]
MARLIAPATPRSVAPTPAPAPSPGPAAFVPALPPSDTPLGDDPAQPSAGERSLLRRGLGRAGTVLTSWRGVLAPGSLAPRRKSLLGE